MRVVFFSAALLLLLLAVLAGQLAASDASAVQSRRVDMRLLELLRTAGENPQNQKKSSRLHIGPGDDERKPQAPQRLPSRQKPQRAGGKGKDDEDPAGKKIGKCQLEWMSCKDVDQYLTVWSLNQILIDIRRMDTLRLVDRVFYDRSFDDTLAKIEKAVEWTTKIAKLAGIPGLDDVADVYNFIKSMKDNVERIAEMVSAQQYELAEYGAKAHLSSFVEIQFKLLRSNLESVKKLLDGADKNPKLLYRWMHEKLNSMEEKWIDVASKAACAVDVALNNKPTKVGFWLAQIGLTIAGACGAAPVTIPIQIGLGATQLVGSGAETANSFNFDNKLQYVLLKAYFLEAFFTGEIDVPLDATQRSHITSGRGGDMGPAPRPRHCNVLREADRNHGCEPDYWCQIEFSFVRNAGTARGDGWCLPRFLGSHTQPEGSPCMDHSGCQSSFCHIPGRFSERRSAELSLDVRKEKLVGRCRVPAASGAATERIEGFDFHIKKIASADASSQRRH